MPELRTTSLRGVARLTPNFAGCQEQGTDQMRNAFLVQTSTVCKAVVLPPSWLDTLVWKAAVVCKLLKHSCQRYGSSAVQPPACNHLVNLAEFNKTKTCSKVISEKVKDDVLICSIQAILEHGVCFLFSSTLLTRVTMV